MLDFSGSTTVYLACGVTDLRKSYTGLAAIIKLKFHLDPYSRCMFAFCNRRRTLIKILQWDGSGFWILMKRLDRDAFHWPDVYYGKNVPLFRRNGYRKSGAMIP